MSSGNNEDANKPMAEGIQSLLTLVSSMRTMNAESAGSPLNPKVILSGSGIEVRFAEEMEQTAGSAEWFNRIDKELKELRETNATLSRTVSELEAKLRTQGDALETLRASVEQNEQMMETLVDSMNLMEDLGDAASGDALVIPSDTRTS
jgi:uncharacterized coiled-coil protein SlyX